MDEETLNAAARLVDDWFTDQHHNHPERYTVDTYNEAHAAKEDLKNRILALKTKTP